MRNFMGYDRRWLDEPHIGDHVGRSVWALGEILATAWIAGVVEPARGLLERLVGALTGEVSLRTAAYTVLGLSRLDADRLEPQARRLLERLADQLADAYRSNAGDGWRWFEDRLSYDNARLPQALLSGGSALGRDDLTELGLESLRWFGDECGLRDDLLRLPGHHGRRRGEPAPDPGDEQPLDAAALVEAELAAFAITHRPSTASGRAARSSGSSAATGSSGHSTTSQPAAAAMGSATRSPTRTKAPSRRSPSTAPLSSSTPQVPPPPSAPPHRGKRTEFARCDPARGWGAATHAQRPSRRSGVCSR